MKREDDEDGDNNGGKRNNQKGGGNNSNDESNQKGGGGSRKWNKAWDKSGKKNDDNRQHTQNTNGQALVMYFTGISKPAFNKLQIEDLFNFVSQKLSKGSRQKAETPKRGYAVKKASRYQSVIKKVAIRTTKVIQS
jgi:hypothetical protein